MSDREMEKRHLAQSDEHIAQAEANIVKIRKFIFLLEDNGRDTTIQMKLLSTMLVTMELFYDHRDMILEALHR